MFENTQSLQQYRSYLTTRLNPVERFTDLLSGRDDRQDFTNLLLYELLQVNSTLATLLAGGTGGTGGIGGSGGTITLPKLGVKSVEIMNLASVTTNELKAQKMANVQVANRVLLVVLNAFNQEVTVKVMGNSSDSIDSAYLINTYKIAAGERGAYGLKLEEWMPFIACTVTPSVNPTLGTVTASVITQEAV
ncbi:MAG: hypothetical protein A9183_00725 [Dehalococcoides mccartyi]|uniref:hypothetical protein n=1 Tax=Dehalococcoides mccartyi TaxID=61435 RepID=UPI000805F032|nr:hypothetical protein [Dehalococcoides mccartyi]OBW62933.1 MAG: hypothetical protein A9183_00725 [Dehalococcoides mccartyi]